MPRGKRIPKAILHDTKMTKYVMGKYSLTSGVKVREYKIEVKQTDTLQSIDVEKMVAIKHHHEEEKIFLESPPFIVMNPKKEEQ